MAVAVVGIRVEVKGIGAAISAFAMLEKSIHGVVQAAKGLKGVKMPSKINYASPYKGFVTQTIEAAAPGAKVAAADLTKVAASQSALAVSGAIAGKVVLALAKGLLKLAVAAGSALLKLGSAIGGGLIGAVSALGRGLMSLIGKVLSTGTAIRTLGRNITNSGRSLSGFGSQLAMLGQRLMGFVTLPIAAMFVGTTKAAMDLESQIIGLQTTVGITKEEALAFKDGMMALVPALGAAPIELATAGYRILSSGIRDTSMALFVLERAGMMSAIGMGEVFDMARVTTAAFVAYGGEAMETADQLKLVTDITDVFVAAVQRGASEADELVEPLGRLLGMASNLSVSIAEVTAFIGTFTAAGGTASEGVTAMTRIMASFVKETGKSKAALAAIGQTTESITAILAEHGFGATLQFLASEFDDAGVALSEFIGRLPGLNAAMFLTGGAAELYAENLAEIKDGVGALDRAFQTVQQSTEFQWKMMVASVQALAIAIGDVLLPILNRFIQAMLPIIANIIAFTQQHPGIVKVVLALAAIAAVVGPLVVGIGLFLTSMGAIISVIGAAIGVIGALINGLWLLAVPFAAVAGLVGLFAISFNRFTDKLVEGWDDAIVTVVEGANGVETVVETKWEQIVRHAKVWGANVILSFATGMASKIIEVVKTLIQIGNVIRSWLQGHSPPKLLPELADWGANVIDTFLHGMTQADFSIFNSVASTISSLFRSLAEDQIGEEGVIPAILGSRTAMAEALASGNLTADLLDRIVGSYGHLSTDAANYVMTMLELATATDAVKEAQEELNRENEQYSAAMDGLNKELESFKRFGEALNNADRKRVLLRRLNDPRTSDEEKQLIMMELRALEIKQIQQGLTDEHDMNAEIAEAKLKAAQDEEKRLKAQADMQLAILNIQIEQNNLMKEQIKLIEDLVEKLKKTPSAGGSGVAGMGEPGEMPEAPDLMSVIRDAIGNILTGGGEGDGEETLWDKIKALFAPLGGDEGLIAGLAEVWSDIFIEIYRILDENKGKMGKWLYNAIKEGYEWAWPYVKSYIKKWWNSAWPAIKYEVWLLYEKTRKYLTKKTRLLGDWLNDKWEKFLKWAMTTPVGEWWMKTGKKAWDKLVGYWDTYITPAFQSRFKFFGDTFKKIGKRFGKIWNEIVMPILVRILPLIPPIVVALMTLWLILQPVIDKVLTFMVDFGLAIADLGIDYAIGVIEDFTFWLDVTLPEAISTAIPKLMTMAGAALGIARLFTGGMDEIGTEFKTTSEEMGMNWTTDWATYFESWKENLPAWVQGVIGAWTIMSDWWNNVFLRIWQDIWDFLMNSIAPLITELMLLFGNFAINVGLTIIAALSTLWNLLWMYLNPALENVKKILGAIAIVIDEKVKKALKKFQPLWDTFQAVTLVIGGALQGVWDTLFGVDDELSTSAGILEDDANPQMLTWKDLLIDSWEALEIMWGWLDDLKEMLGTTLFSSADNFIKLILTPMELLLGGIAGWVQYLVGLFGGWNEAMQKLRMAKDLEEDSPSPMERSLTHAREAMEKLIETTAAMQNQFSKKTALNVSGSDGLNIADVDAANRRAQSAMIVGRAQAERDANINIGPNSINNGMDMAVFEAMVRRSIAKAMG